MSQVRILVKVTLARREAAVSKALRSLGGEHISVCEELHKLQALVPLQTLPSLVGLPGAERVSLEVVRPVASDDAFFRALDEAQWPSIFGAWRSICAPGRERAGGAAGADVVPPAVFVRGKRTEPDVLVAVGQQLAARGVSVAARGEDADLALVVTSAPGTGIRAAGVPIFTRLAQHKPLPHWGLHPSVAWAMGEVARLKPTEVVLDPCAGVAALLLELAKHWPRGRYVGLELDGEVASKGHANIMASRSGDRVKLELGDATAMSIPDASVDVVLSDLPFGRQHGTVEGNAELYPRLLKEAARVLRPDGRAVLLTGEESSHLLSAGARLAGFTIVAEIPLKFGGAGDDHDCILFCLGRGGSTTEEAFDLVQGGGNLSGAERWNVVEKWRYAMPLLRPVRPL
eukprot:CAMPEP_0204193270 /NCGR_PEP_ID=MMETSP0361-20130328/61530_1 /ASSEMBLY_ACC=CAM_ASM_000343 /TAXON_ID=268821 /ORGANISM="Scrippsiella Hangoei, Strain SHTV-5" /LENGTH=400 /DNA_ID=CAMNT_0051154453 /DNA_START=26 /DNA_END=1225 /DNA_ORIENTATION=-